MTADHSDLIGKSLGQYKVVALLGAGGMGEVYKAEDSRLGRQVALKLLPPAMRDDPERRARLRREAQAASRLHSPSIAATHDLGEIEGSLFIVMEYVEGETLSRRLERGPLDLPRAIRVAMQVADALDEAHGVGILHRDVKSANLMITGRERVKVLDFGLTRFTESFFAGDHQLTSAITLDQPTVAGALLGTVSYMSPEQALGQPVDHRSDLFSLGVVMYEMVTANLPFVGGTPLAISDAILHAAPPAMGGDPGEAGVAYERIAGRCLEKAPEARYQSARALHDDLEQLRRGLDASAYLESTGSGSVVAHPASVAPSLPSPARLPAPAPEACRVVAVMPFANITRRRDDDWIGTGIAETVTADLKAIRGLTVIGSERVYDAMHRTGVSGVGDVGEPGAIDLGRRLGAAWIVTGGFQRMAEALRITARAVDVGSGEVARTVKVDGPMAEIFQLQDRVVHELGGDLNRAAGLSSVSRDQRTSFPSVAAFECFSRGRLRLRESTRDSMDQAILLFERAVELDPGYALAWAALAAAYGMKGQFHGLPALIDKAAQMSRRALALDPRLPEAHQWLGSAYQHQGKVDEARHHLAEAIRLDPTSSISHILLSRVLWLHQARIDEAIEAAERALRLSPEAGHIHMQLGLMYTLRGRYQEAETACLKAIELEQRADLGLDEMRSLGARMRLGYVYYRQGRYDEAIRAYQQELAELAAHQDHALSERTMIELQQKLGAALLRGGRAEDAGKHLARAIESYRARRAAGTDDPATQYYVACAHALAGDVEQAVRLFTASSEKLPAYNRWRGARDPDLEAVRSELVAGGLIEAADWPRRGRSV